MFNENQVAIYGVELFYQANDGSIHATSDILDLSNLQFATWVEFVDETCTRTEAFVKDIEACDQPSFARSSLINIWADTEKRFLAIHI